MYLLPRLGLLQESCHRGLAALLRNLQRGGAVVVDCLGVGFGLQQQLDHRLAAVDRGIVEDCPPIVGQDIRLSFGLEEIADDGLVASGGGQHQRCYAVNFFGLNIRL